jgi:dolichol kinase
VGAATGLLIGWVLLPLSPLEARLRRPGEAFLGGLRTYPLAVLGLVLLLPRAEAAAAWGVLAFGDAGAAVVGSHVPSPAVWGHKKATWAGSGAYVVLGSLGAFALSRGCAALESALGWVDVGPVPAVSACLAGALGAALIDLVPIPPDDNLPAAAAAGTVLWLVRELQ